MDFIKFLSKELNIALNEQQIQACLHYKGPALVLAGPGSGKTTVITARTAYLIMEKGIAPDRILTLTFNRASRHDMENRFNNSYSSYIGQKVRFTTFHSFCNSVIRDYERLKGRTLKLIEGEEGLGESKRRILRDIYYSVNSVGINDDELETLMNEIGLVKNKMLKDFDGIDLMTKGFDEIYRSYESYKKDRLLMDFDDMLTYTYIILSKFPDILQRYRSRYSYIQVDEGQDLSKIQFEILKLLVSPVECNVFIVADDDQSIYGFRGAEPGYILSMEKEYTGCRVYKLENNYRSSRNIVDLTSNFIKKNKNRYDKNHKTENPEKTDPIIIKAKDEDDQLIIILDKIRSIYKKDKGKSIAVLFRSNLSSIVLVEAFERNNIAFRLKESRLFFFKHWAVLDILAFLRFSLDQNERDAFKRICFKMNRYISRQMLVYAEEAGYSGSIIDAVLDYRDLKPFQRSKISELKGEFDRLSRLKPVDALDYIESGFNYFESVKEYCDSTGMSFDYIYGMFGILRTIAQNFINVADFLVRIEELQGILEGHSGLNRNNATILSTIHSSKGLEFDSVFMFDLLNAETPGKKAVELIKDNDYSVMEEERRLFYVGMTRARENLYLVYPFKKNLCPESRSSFINEVAQLQNKGTLDGLGEGVIIKHKKYGEGIIINIIEKKDKTTLEIDFNGLMKKLDFLTCMEGGLLSF